MKTIDNLLARIKEGVKEKGKKLIIPLTLTTLLTASAQDARADLKKVWQEIKNRTSIEVGIEHNFKNPAEEYFNKLNQDFRDGKYTATSPIPEWQNIETGRGLTMPSVNVSVRVADTNNIIKNSNLETVFGYKWSKGNETNCSKNYIVDNLTTLITRNESFDFTSPFIGLRGRAEISKKIDTCLSFLVNFFKVKGSANVSLHVPKYNTTRYYVQNYSGENKGYSIEVTAGYKLNKHLSINITAGYEKGNILTGGNETITLSQAPGWSLVRDYNAEFRMNSASIKGRLEYKF